jgi:hypothetical protein
MIYFEIEIAGENKIFSQSKLPKPFRPRFPPIAESCSCTQKTISAMNKNQTVYV